MISNVSGVLKTYGVYKTDEKHPAHKQSRSEEYKDTVAISGKAQDYQSARAALLNVPDVRDEVVAAVKQKYESSINPVQISDIADKLISRM